LIKNCWCQKEEKGERGEKRYEKFENFPQKTFPGKLVPLNYPPQEPNYGIMESWQF
jgi:hypothetical protein